MSDESHKHEEKVSRPDTSAKPPAPKTKAGAESSGKSENQSRSRRQRIEDFIWNSHDETARDLSTLFHRWLQIFDRALRGFARNRCSPSASSLTYTSLLTIVPLLAILLALLTGFGLHDVAKEALKRLPFVQQVSFPRGQGSTILGPATETPGSETAQPPASQPPVEKTRPSTAIIMGLPVVFGLEAVAENPDMITGPQLVDQLFSFVDRTDIGNLGLFGVFGVMLAVLSLMSRIEDSMNLTWGIKRSRSIGRKIIDYMNLLLFMGLMLVAMSVTVTGKIFGDFTNVLDRIGLSAIQETLIRVLPYVVIIFAFVFMYYYVPNTRVRWRSAGISGLIAGTIFEASIFLLINLQVVLFARYNKIYGAFAVILIILIWIYVSWMIFLLGAELCNAHQNLRDWRRRRRPWHGRPEEYETLALRLAAMLAAPLLTRNPGLRKDVADLADTLMIPTAPINELLDLFQKNGLVIQSSDTSAYVLAQSPEQVSVLDLLRLVRHGALNSTRHPDTSLLGEVSSTLRQPLADMTARDLAGMPLDQIRSFSF